MHWRDGLAIVAAIVALASCSDDPQLARSFDASPEVLATSEPRLLASGIAIDPGRPSAAFNWDLEEIAGFSHAVTFRAESPTVTTVRSASRRDLNDPVWLVGTMLDVEGPSMVFGGAAGGIESLLVINAEGEEFTLELREVPGFDWQFAIGQLPEDWTLGSAPGPVEVVAIQDGSELVREELLGLQR